MARKKILSEEQAKINIQKSNQNWKDNNPDKVRHYQYKSRAKNFIVKKANREELLELQELIIECLKDLELPC